MLLFTRALKEEESACLQLLHSVFHSFRLTNHRRVHSVRRIRTISSVVFIACSVNDSKSVLLLVVTSASRQRPRAAILLRFVTFKAEQ